MNLKTIIISAIVSVISALAVCLVFFSFIYKSAQSEVKQKPLTETTPTVEPSETPETPTPKIEIKSSQVSSLALNTVYKGYFDENSPCRKSYRELPREDDKFLSIRSLCTLDISFNRDGSATKTIELYNKDSTERKSDEKNTWKAKITDKQFETLLNSVVNTDLFRNWNDMILMTVVNSRIKVTYPKGVRTLMSNVDARTTAFLPLIDSFKQLDGKIKWEKAN